MNTTAAEIQATAKDWQVYCQRHPERFLAIPGSPMARKLVERWEEERVEQLHNQQLSTLERAIALRSIVELRYCTTRDVATFFAVPVEIVVCSMPLMPLPAASGAKARRSGKSRGNKVA